jgi:hypothetical protein
MKAQAEEGKTSCSKGLKNKGYILYFQAQERVKTPHHNLLMFVILGKKCSGNDR